MEKIALTARYPFAGCTRIARELQLNYHYRNISMSKILMEQFSAFLNRCGMDVSVRTIMDHKELYRRQLHSYATEHEDTFIQTLESLIIPSLNPSIVIEKVRTDKQVHMLKRLGFTIVRIERPEHDVLRTAYRHGHNEETWNALLASGSEGRVSDMYIDDTLTNTFTSDIITKYLVSTDTVGVPRD